MNRTSHQRKVYRKIYKTKYSYRYRHLTADKIKSILKDILYKEPLPKLQAWAITRQGLIPIEETKEFDDAMKAEVAKIKAKKEPYNWSQQIAFSDRRLYKKVTYEDIVKRLEPKEDGTDKGST